MDPIFDAVKQNLDSMLGVPFVSSAVTLGLAFYAYKAGPELPSFMEELFLNVFFRVFIGFMVLYMITRNVLLSFIVSTVFIYGVGMLSNLKEGMIGPGGPFCDGPGCPGCPCSFPIARPSPEKCFSKFIKYDFENALIDKLKNSDLADIISQKKVDKLVTDLTLKILKDNGYTLEDMGTYLYGNIHDINKYINNALTKARLELVKMPYHKK